MEKVILIEPYNILYSKKFSEKVQSIYRYLYYQLKNPIASYNFQIKILQTISILKFFPFIGPKYKNTNYRYLTFQKWLIFYTVQEQKVKVIFIFHTKQNFNSNFNP